MNKELNNRVYKLPEDIITHLKYQVKQNKPDTDGMLRANNLLNDGSVTFGQLRRIMHDINKIDKTKDIVRYNLYGGDLMSRWGNNIINNEQDAIKRNKTSRKRSDDITSITGERKNAFLKKHTKKQSFIPPTNIIKSNSMKNSISDLKLGKLFEEILNNL